jgi:hypothetical protein
MSFLKSIFSVFKMRKAVFVLTDIRGDQFEAKALFKGKYDRDQAIEYIKSELPIGIQPVRWDFKGIEG